MVVLRPNCSVSAEGGGGRFDKRDEMDARQRKHSPVP